RSAWYMGSLSLIPGKRSRKMYHGFSYACDASAGAYREANPVIGDRASPPPIAPILLPPPPPPAFRLASVDASAVASGSVLETMLPPPGDGAPWFAHIGLMAFGSVFGMMAMTLPFQEPIAIASSIFYGIPSVDGGGP